jgi:hypothetical protein
MKLMLAPPAFVIATALAIEALRSDDISFSHTWSLVFM